MSDSGTIISISDDNYSEAVQFLDRFKSNNVWRNNQFFDWQYNSSAVLAGSDEDNGTFLFIQDGHIAAISMAVKTRFHFKGKLIVGAWHTEWFSKKTVPGTGFRLIWEQLRRNPILCTSGQSLYAANVLLRMRKHVWFEAERLFVVFNAKAALDLTFSSEDQTKAFLQLQGIPRPEMGTDLELIDQFDDQYEDLWIRLRDRFVLSTDRSASYMRWRYLDHPIFEYQCCRCRTRNGQVFFVWRVEQVPETPHRVIRICEAIGEPEILVVAFPVLYDYLSDGGYAFADFFCSNASVNGALVAAGMRPVITMHGLDLARLFSPLSDDPRKRLNYSYSLQPSLEDPACFQYSNTCFTKGDTNQDIPNPFST